MRRIVLVGFVCLALGACGDDAQQDEGDASSSSSAGESGEGSEASGESTATSQESGEETGGEPSGTDAMALAYCEKIFGCCGQEELDEIVGFYDPTPTDVPSCVAIMAGLLSYEEGGLLDLEAAGSIDYDAEGTYDCAAAIDAASCEDWHAKGDPFADLVDDPACADLVTPLVEEGQPCTQDRMCTTGECDLVDDVCAPARLPYGASCISNYECQEPYQCEVIGSAGTCTDPVPPGGDCNLNSDCGYGHCDNEIVGGAGVCATLCVG